MSLLLKNLAIVICCIYYYFKILNIPFSKDTKLYISILGVLSLIISTLTDYYCPIYTMPITIIFLAIFLGCITKSNFQLSIVTTSLAFGFSYFLASIISSIICVVLVVCSGQRFLFLARSICCILQICLMPLPFQLPRLRNGMPFLRSRHFSTSGVIICICIMICSIFLNNNTYQPFYTLIIFFLFLLGIFIYRYWQNNLTKSYLDQLQERNMIDLNDMIAEQSEEIARLADENKRLSEIVHKDNKLIPTLEFSIQDFFESNSITDTIALQEGNKLRQWMTSLSAERKELIHQQELACKKFKSTNITCIDQYLKYVQNVAFQNHIDFQATISFDVQHFLNHIIEQREFETLLQDLLDNALHSSKENNGCHMLLTMNIVSDVYTISIFDSGNIFPADILTKWGIEPISTKPNGSGIGLMTAYSILKKYNASFIIHEFGKDNLSFTKEVSISFDNKSNYILQTNRSEQELKLLSKRPDLQIIYSS